MSLTSLKRVRIPGVSAKFKLKLEFGTDPILPHRITEVTQVGYLQVCLTLHLFYNFQQRLLYDYL